MRYLLYIAFFISSLSAQAQHDTLFDQSVLLLQKEKFKDANKLLEQVILKDSTNLAAYFNLGLSYFEIKDYGNAIWAFEKCLRMDPSNSDVENALTLTYLKIDPDGALKLEQTSVPALARIRPFIWGLMGITISILISSIIFMLAKGNQRQLKGFLAFTTIILVLGLLFSFYGGSVSSQFRDQSNKGIITSEALIYLKDLTPSNNSLPIGTIVSIEDTLDGLFILGKSSKNTSVIIDLSTLRPL